jgi:hypothetical protein
MKTVIEICDEQLDHIIIETLQESIYLEMQFDKDDSYIHSALRVLKDFMCYSEYVTYRENILRDLYGEEV